MWLKVINTILTVVIGIGVALMLYWLLNKLAELLPKGAEEKLKPWLYILPAYVALIVYLIYPTILAFIGFDPAAILFGAGVATTASLMSHCGAGLHASWLNRIFVTPEVHRWHHSAKVPEGHRYSVNYGVGIVLWDRLLGTYLVPR